MLFKAYFNWVEKLPGEPRLKTVVLEAKDIAEANVKVKQYLTEHYSGEFTQLTKVTSV